MYPRKKIKQLVGALKQLQDTLGDFNDYHVQIESLRHIEQQMADEVGLSDDTRTAIDELMDVLYRNQQAIRGHFRERFDDFSQPHYRQLFKQLFRPDDADSDADAATGGEQQS
jgi:CHAD domain-containing protein